MNNDRLITFICLATKFTFKILFKFQMFLMYIFMVCSQFSIKSEPSATNCTYKILLRLMSPQYVSFEVVTGIKHFWAIFTLWAFTIMGSLLVNGQPFVGFKNLSTQIAQFWWLWFSYIYNWYFQLLPFIIAWLFWLDYFIFNTVGRHTKTSQLIWKHIYCSSYC